MLSPAQTMKGVTFLSGNRMRFDPPIERDPLRRQVAQRQFILDRARRPAPALQAIERRLVYFNICSKKLTQPSISENLG